MNIGNKQSDDVSRFVVFSTVVDWISCGPFALAPDCLGL